MPRPNPEHPRPWHREAVYGDGPRRILDARERSLFVNQLGAHARKGLISGGAERTGLALLSFLDWKTGQCDPSHAAIGQRVREQHVSRSDRSVIRDLDQLRAIGLVSWEQRLVRCGWRAEQTSNAYVLNPEPVGELPLLPTRPTQAVRSVLPVAPVSPSPKPIESSCSGFSATLSAGGAGTVPVVALVSYEDALAASRARALKAWEADRAARLAPGGHRRT